MVHKRTLDAKEKYEGAVFKTNNYGDVIVLEYVNSNKVLIKFINTAEQKWTTIANLKSGGLRSKKGYTEEGKQNSRLRKSARSKHKGMFDRCYNPKYSDRYPTYKDCIISESFKNLDFFYEWCLDQVGFGNENWHLDKDILIKGNKIYSEDTCCFVPREINLALVNQKSSRGLLPLGVSYNRTFNLYYSRVRKHNKTVDLGFYTTPEDAFLAYKQAKESYLKELANKWKDKIDSRVYDALMNWTIEITD